MKHIMAAVALFVAAPAAAETPTNDSIVALAVASLGHEAIIAKIKAFEVRFTSPPTN